MRTEVHLYQNQLSTKVPLYASLESADVFALSCIPCAIPESEYIAPMSQKFTSNDNRKNWSDIQETAQWLGGCDIPRRLLESLQIGGASPELRLMRLILSKA